MEQSPPGTLVGSLSASDTYPGASFTYTLVDSAGGSFTLGGPAGDQLLSTVPLSAAQTPTLMVMVQVTDSGLASKAQTFSITVEAAQSTGSTTATQPSQPPPTVQASGTQGSSGKCGIGGGLALLGVLLSAFRRSRKRA